MKERILGQLEPAGVFRFFEDLTRIPRGSGHTRAVSDYCAAFARERGLKVRQDEHNNVIIWKDGTGGLEDRPAVILQGHLDMVLAKTPDCSLDMEREGLQIEVTKDGFVRAKGTTLGADNGIAVAMILALLDDGSIPHPPLEAVFTSDEEIGLLGAAALDCSDLRGRVMMNLDSEEEGYLTVGCAGGARCDIQRNLRMERSQGTLCRVIFSGFAGGHSGMEIGRGRANTNQLTARLLTAVEQASPVRLVRLEGGKLDNAITAHTEAEFLLSGDAEQAREAAQAWWQEERRSFADTDGAGDMAWEELGSADLEACTEADSRLAAALLCRLPSGVIAMSQDIPGLVETSANFGVLLLEQGHLQATVSVRSSLNHAWKGLLADMESIAGEYGAAFSSRGKYPAWEYRKESRLRPLMVEVYRELFGQEPVVETIHAGLECGIFCDKIPGLDSVSFGPQLYDVHTPRERMSVASVQRTWDYLLHILARL